MRDTSLATAGLPKRVLRALILGIALLLATSLAGCGGNEVPPAREPGDAALTVPAPYDPGKPEYKAVRRESRYLTMRDGVKIAIDVYLPKTLPAGAKLPAILHQTRYWRSVDTRWPFSMWMDKPRPWVTHFIRHGYAWVSADARGSGASFGVRPYPWHANEVKDGAEIVDWIVAQPWSNGRVGTTGVSYDGTTAEFLVTNDHPAVKAAIPRFSLFDAYADIAFPGGVHQVNFTRQWGVFNDLLDKNTVPPQFGFLGRMAVAGVRPVDADADGSMLQAAVAEHQRNWDVHAMALKTTYVDDAIESIDGEKATTRAFSPASFVEQLDASGTPIYSYSGWFDGAYQHAAIKRYMTLSDPRNKLILGPWTHGGRYSASPANPGATRFDHQAEMLKFFDHYLRHRETVLDDDKPVHYFTMVEGKWKAADAWPPPATRVTYYLGPDGILVRDAPNAADAFDEYQVDYKHGTGTQSRWDTLLTGGFVAYPDRKKQDKRLLVYESAPLVQDTEVTGHPIVTLYVTSTATDGAFFVYLEDVDGEGNVAYVTEGMLRALHRKVSSAKPPYVLTVPYHSFERADGAPLVPGDLAELTFDLLPTSYVFRAGHKLRIAIAGADKDHFALVPPDGPPTIRVYREANRASRLVLPVIARGE